MSILDQYFTENAKEVAESILKYITIRKALGLTGDVQRLTNVNIIDMIIDSPRFKNMGIPAYRWVLATDVMCRLVEEGFIAIKRIDDKNTEEEVYEITPSYNWDKYPGKNVEIRIKT